MPDLSAPWRGVHVATALPFQDDDELSVDYEGYAAHVRFLAEHGCDGVCPNGSLGEYQTLTDEERARVVRVAVEAAPEGFGVMPGVAAYGALESRRWAEQAGEAGARAVLALPPNSYRADREAVVGHYREVARAGLPVVAYNNPHDTKVDLTPELLAELHGEGLIVAVKEFSGDVRRAYEIAERAPGLDLLIGADDVLLELGLAGAVGWIAGYPNAIPDATVELYRLATSGVGTDLEKALPLYRALHPLLRWDSRTEFVQAIKASMDLAGLRGGSCRPPRSRLAGEVAARVVRETETVLALGYR
ncbi:dihydrodipicolinate synthase family protein [Streptomyces rapamycinicus]|uniref:Dihydrodipicolinate synthase n=2 Tax=Streptomyces rapamycinicus TaxID=1226757 RepID=A0A0A0NAF4_STRRN|nr:dihydrodipicolinate synthase family protein [Streptomyces rapamycinicus]AGP56407.1 dihydrodipicolinate synthase [Streptomyces rapamycinicus NRRL 5491]MBB4784006.1 4-hydroxy-tetrahydrodipicolinate synthase [Streptomyces rapamycinicus]RLV80509.1 dihydrodipicolinate synthase [Streptomyces rapamycinicus NRRL 5491]UTO64353.1 dihydrodipicolinate synthase family protein [Streptomyces rapamycinicus]UTP32308.1 dihydrodipicolinate synthase family protein [Streptomyces rapamycinicus NRRL 5491]